MGHGAPGARSVEGECHDHVRCMWAASFEERAHRDAGCHCTKEGLARRPATLCVVFGWDPIHRMQEPIGWHRRPQRERGELGTGPHDSMDGTEIVALSQNPLQRQRQNWQPISVVGPTTPAEIFGRFALHDYRCRPMLVLRKMRFT